MRRTTPPKFDVRQTRLHQADFLDGDGSYGFKGQAIVDDVRIGDIALQGYEYLLNVTEPIAGFQTQAGGILGLGPDGSLGKIFSRCDSSGRPH